MKKIICLLLFLFLNISLWAFVPHEFIVNAGKSSFTFSVNVKDCNYEISLESATAYTADFVNLCHVYYVASDETCFEFDGNSWSQCNKSLNVDIPVMEINSTVIASCGGERISLCRDVYEKNSFILPWSSEVAWNLKGGTVLLYVSRGGSFYRLAIKPSTPLFDASYELALKYYDSSLLFDAAIKNFSSGNTSEYSAAFSELLALTHRSVYSSGLYICEKSPSYVKNYLKKYLEFQWDCTISWQTAEKLCQSVQKYSEYSVPYVRGGLDTPETFAKKMESISMYLPGTMVKGGNGGAVRNAGISFMGLLSGALYDCGLRNGFGSYISAFGEEFNKSEDFLFKRYDRDFKNALISSDEFNDITVIVPDAELMQRGDIVISPVGTGIKYGIVTVVNATTGYSTVVTVDEIKGGKTRQVMLSDFSDGNGFEIRRLLCAPKKDSSGMNWEILDYAITDSSYSVKYSYEQNQHEKEVRRNFIPNTGECLVLKNITFDLKNRFGFYPVFKERYLDVKTVFSSGFSVKFISDDLNGFDSSLHKGKLFFDTRTKSLSALSEDGLYHIPVKTLEIRPDSPENCDTGKKFTLEFEIGKNRVKDAQKTVYRIYDKKLLWRANLYLNDACSGVLDWNARYPWKALSKGTMEWGINEWNVKCNENSDYNRMESFSESNGKQTSVFVPFRQNEGDEEVMHNRVGWCNVNEENNAWDSPFTFLHKIVLYDYGICAVQWAGVDNLGFIRRSMAYSGCRYVIEKLDPLEKENSRPVRFNRPVAGIMDKDSYYECISDPVPGDIICFEEEQDRLYIIEETGSEIDDMIILGCTRDSGVHKVSMKEFNGKKCRMVRLKQGK